MKFALHLLLVALFVVLAYATTEQKSVIISYPKDTANHVLDQAKAAIIKAGGVITHEYNIIKAFAATAPAEVFENVQTMDAKYQVVVEEDQMVSIQSSS